MLSLFTKLLFSFLINIWNRWIALDFCFRPRKGTTKASVLIMWHTDFTKYWLHVCLKVQKANWFSVVFFSLLGKEVSRRKIRSFSCAQHPGPSWCSPTCDCGFRPHSELRVRLQMVTLLKESDLPATTDALFPWVDIGTILPSPTAGLWHLETSG